VVSVDLTMLLEIVLIIILVVVLNALLYRPLLAKMKERRDRLDNDDREIKNIQTDIQKIRTTIDRELQSARVNAREKITSVTLEEEKKKQTIVSKTGLKTETEVQAFRTEMQQSLEQAKLDAQPELQSIARSIAKKLLPLCAVLMLYSLPALASGGDDHSGINETARIVDFLIMVAILGFLLRKPVSGAMKKRIETIKQSLTDSTNRLKSSHEDHEIFRENQEGMPRKEAAIQEKAEREAGLIQERIAKDCEREVKRIAEKADQQKTLEYQKADHAIRQHIIDETLHQAESQFEDGISEEADRKLVAEFITRFESVSFDSGELDHA
jgi:F-type H+-transporting ATPase subunit b